MILKQIIPGLLSILLGLALMKFSIFFSKLLYFRPQKKINPLKLKTIKEQYGQEKSSKISFYAGVIILMSGLFLLITGLLNIMIIS